MEKKYWANIYVTRMFDPEHDEDIRFTKHFFVDYIREDEETGDTEELKEYAVKHLLLKKDFTPETNCIEVNAYFYRIGEEPPFDDTVSEPHTYIFLDDYVRIKGA